MTETVDLAKYINYLTGKQIDMVFRIYFPKDKDFYYVYDSKFIEGG